MSLRSCQSPLASIEAPHRGVNCCATNAETSVASRVERVDGDLGGRGQEAVFHNADFVDSNRDRYDEDAIAGGRRGDSTYGHERSGNRTGLTVYFNAKGCIRWLGESGMGEERTREGQEAAMPHLTLVYCGRDYSHRSEIAGSVFAARRAGT
jgi:hypothetical protein